MVQKKEQSCNFSLIFGMVTLFILMLSLPGCSGLSEPAVKYDDTNALKNDCANLLTNEQTASISGPLDLYEKTLCSTDEEGEYCKLLLGFEEYLFLDKFLDIWVKTGGRNGMDDLPDPYNTFDLVVHADDGEDLSVGDMVTTTLQPFLEMENGQEVCSFRVKTILRSIIVASENQPGEGMVNLRIPANGFWVDTNIYVNQGQRLLIVPGYGAYNLQDENPNWDANSYTMLGVSDTLCENNCIINGENYGMLVAKINDGQPFLVTIKTSEMIIPANGELFLAVNDCTGCYENNSGTFDLNLYLNNVP
jgi:hypothetical protein